MTTAEPEVQHEQSAQQAAAVLDGVLAAAQTLLSCEMVAYNRIAGEQFVAARTRGHLPGLSTGARAEREKVHCQLMLDGAVHATSSAPLDPDYGRLQLTSALSLQTYVGVPVVDDRGAVRGTLCGFDRRSVEVPERTLSLLFQLAGILTPHADGLADLDAVLRRRGGHWTVEGVDEPHTGRSLAALLARTQPAAPDDEAAGLRADLVVLEKAVQDRVVQEQAIGVLAERHAVEPVAAYRVLSEPPVPLLEAARAVMADAGRSAQVVTRPSAAVSAAPRPAPPRPGPPRPGPRRH